jgi:citrate lyase subunit beta/citryl-CoA lyase
MSTIDRSLLFVPGNRPERFTKACDSGADAVIIDLEDAVPPTEKSQARAAVAAWLKPERPVFLRINAGDTPWFRDDCELARVAGVAAILLPKAERIEEIVTLSSAGAGKPVLPIIETAAGFDNIQAIARAQGVQRLVFGSIDFQLDLGISGDDAELLMFRSGIVLASKLAGLQAPVDGVSTAIDDAQGLAADAARSRKLGFGGKLCIHPRQVGGVNAAFSPSDEELAWARRILDAAVVAGGAAIAVDGKMVDRPVMLRAQAILDQGRPRT